MKIDFVMVFGYFEMYCKTSVFHEYRADTLFKDLKERTTGQLVFLQ